MDLDMENARNEENEDEESVMEFDSNDCNSNDSSSNYTHCYPHYDFSSNSKIGSNSDDNHIRIQVKLKTIMKILKMKNILIVIATYQSKYFLWLKLNVMVSIMMITTVKVK